MNRKAGAIAARIVIVLLVLGIAWAARTGMRLLTHGTISSGTYPKASSYEIGDFDYDPDGIETVEIDWVDGDVNITQASSATLSVTETGKGLKDAQRLHWIRDGSKLVIQYCDSGYNGSFPAKSKNLSVEIPNDVDLIVSSVSADVTLKDKQDLCDLRLSSVSGNVRCDSLSLTGRGEFDTVSGDLTLDLRSARELAVASESGNATLSLPKEGATVTFESLSGDLNADGFAKDDDQYVFGDGACHVEVSTMSGDLTID